MTVGKPNRSIVLTPPGPGAIGVVRVVGSRAHAIVAKVFRSKNGHPLPSKGDERLRYGWIVDGSERIDDVIVSCAPFTDEPAVDICCHGGVRVLESILVSLERCGAPLLEGEVPGELVWPAPTMIDREIVAALVRSKTARAVRFLGWQRGHLVSTLERIASKCRSDSRRGVAELEEMIRSYRPAHGLIEGATVAIVGPANSGKSTLFNRLMGRSTTLVSPRAGTTRDWVAGSVEMEGVPVTLVDTAGCHRAGERLDWLAFDAGWQESRRADLCLLLLDGSAPLSADALRLLEACRSFPLYLIVISKMDAGLAWDDGDLGRSRAEGELPPRRISAQTGEGVERLVQDVLILLGYGNWTDAAACFFTQRQVDAAHQTLSDLGGSPLAAEETMRARLIGKHAADDIAFGEDTI